MRQKETGMNLIHSLKRLYKGDVVELTCDSTCNFMLTDDRDKPDSFIEDS